MPEVDDHDNLTVYHIYADDQNSYCGVSLKDMMLDTGREKVAVEDSEEPPDGHICHDCLRGYNIPNPRGGRITEEELRILCQPQKDWERASLIP